MCLAIILRHCRQYKGITLNKQTFNESLSADDVAIGLNGRALQLNYAFDIFKAFGQKSSCKVNMNKLNAFYVGSSKGKVSQPVIPSQPVGPSWPQNLVKNLGANIPISCFDSSVLFSKNFPSITRD